MNKKDCADKCPDGFYPDANLDCLPCDSSCKTCFGKESDKCKSCSNINIFLMDGSCTDYCPSGTHFKKGLYFIYK